MNRRRRDERRFVAEAKDVRRARERRAKCSLAAARSVRYAEALAKPRQSPTEIFLLAVLGLGDYDCLPDEVLGLVAKAEEEWFDLLSWILRQCPALANTSHLRALLHLSRLWWRRCPSEWTPSHRSPVPAFVSLASHLVAAIRVPRILYGSFYLLKDSDAAAGTAWFASVAGGRSVVDSAREFLPAALTRREINRFIRTPARHGFMGALRRSQLETAGASKRLVQALSNGSIMHGFLDAPREDFLPRALGWIARHGDLSPEDVAPLLEYLLDRAASDPTFRLRGRTTAPLLKQLDQQRQLHRLHSQFGPALPRASFRGEMAWYSHGVPWEMVQLVQIRDVAAEASAMSNCVLGHVPYAASGELTLWSLRAEGERRATVGVCPPGYIVQATERSNSELEPDCEAALQEWAAMTDLDMDLE
ncbi:MAG: hypothetical protein GY898_03100 [Proteobacteria bacterium]|nr:hypothetical protein [Pseudomonadota bacterium]